MVGILELGPSVSALVSLSNEALDQTPTNAFAPPSRAYENHGEMGETGHRRSLSVILERLHADSHADYLFRVLRNHKERIRLTQVSLGKFNLSRRGGNI